MGRTCLDDCPQCVLHVGYHFGLGHLLAKHLRREFLHHLAVFHVALDESRVEQFAVIGNACIEVDNIDGRNLRGIANGQTRQVPDIRPMAPFVLRAGNVGLVIGAEGQFEVGRHTYSLHTINKGLRVVLVVIPYHDGGTCVERPFNNLEYVLPFRAFDCVVVLDAVAGAEGMHRALNRDAVVHFDASIVHSHHETTRFEHRARHLHSAKRIVHAFLISLAVLPLAQTDDSLHIAVGHVHKDAVARIGIEAHHFVHEGLVANVLHIYVERGHDVQSVFHGLVHDGHDSIAHLFVVASTRFTCQNAVIGFLDSVACAVFEEADGQTCQAAVRHIAYFHLVSTHTAPVLEEGEFAQLAQLHVGYQAVAFLASGIGNGAYLLGKSGTTATASVEAGVEVFIVFDRIYVGEDLVHACHDFVFVIEIGCIAAVLVVKDGLACPLVSAEVDGHIVLRHHGGKDASVGSQYISAQGADAVFAIGMCLALLVPFFALYGHDAKGLDYYGSAGQDEQDANQREPRHYFFTGKVHRVPVGIRIWDWDWEIGNEGLGRVIGRRWRFWSFRNLQIDGVPRVSGVSSALPPTLNAAAMLTARRSRYLGRGNSMARC